MTINRILDIIPQIRRKSLFLMGPRQTGKSTYIKNQLKDEIALFWNLLDGRLRMRVQADPSILREEIEARDLHDCLVFIDEIQKCPELLEEIHFLIEERNIRFLMTGSSARKLRSSGVNLLGGRALQYHFHPFCYMEIKDLGNITLPAIFEKGMLPSHFLSDNIEEDLSAYVDTYLTEEIAAEGASRNLPAFSQFLQIAALSNSSILNYSNVANDSKVPRQTVKLWYDILINTLLAFEVPPFTKTKKRKAIETAKFYFFDVGVLRALKNIPVPAENTAEFGEFFETYICLELKTWIDYKSPKSKLCYWRSTAGQEVDFIVDEELAIEVKSAREISERHLKGLKALREENIFKRYIVVCQEERPRLVDGIEIFPWKYFLEQLWKY
ncbi:MAG: ATP-binding protein [Treponema sp.]